MIKSGVLLLCLVSAASGTSWILAFLLQNMTGPTGPESATLLWSLLSRDARERACVDCECCRDCLTYCWVLGRPVSSAQVQCAPSLTVRDLPDWNSRACVLCSRRVHAFCAQECSAQLRLWRILQCHAHGSLA